MAFNPDELKQITGAYQEAKENNSYSNDKLPEGVYKVKIDKIELGETGAQSKNPGMPKAKIQFRIIDGDHKNQCLFYNQTLVCRVKDKNDPSRTVLSALGIKICDDFLNSLEPMFDVSFQDCKSSDPFKEYAEILLDVAEECAKLRYDLKLTYKGDFPAYKVEHVYE